MHRVKPHVKPRVEFHFSCDPRERKEYRVMRSKERFIRFRNSTPKTVSYGDIHYVKRKHGSFRVRAWRHEWHIELLVLTLVIA